MGSCYACAFSGNRHILVLQDRMASGALVWVHYEEYGWFLISKKDQDRGKNLSAFQAVTTALAGTVGTGNIAGVTGAVFVGGPGAVFWMWVSAFFGMCTKYAEILLAMKYRETDEKGVYKGGNVIKLRY